MLKPLSVDNKGQSYSTFKLLIAAIIAMAILGILVPIIMQVMGLIKSNPNDETKKLLNNLIDNPGAVEKTGDVVFGSGGVLTGSALAERTALSRDQICMFLGDFDSGNEFSIMKGEPGGQDRIIYNGNVDKTIDVAVICNVNKPDLEADLMDYSDAGLLPTNLSFDCDVCPENSDCCAVILQRT